MPTLKELEDERDEAFAALIPATESLIGKYFLIQHKDSGDYLTFKTSKKGCGKKIGDSEYVMLFHKDKQWAIVWRITGESKTVLSLSSVSGVDGRSVPLGNVQSAADPWGGGDDRGVIRAKEHKAKIDTAKGGLRYEIVGDTWDSLKLRGEHGGLERASKSNDPGNDSNCLGGDDFMAKFDPESGGSVLKFTEVDVTGEPVVRREVEEIELDIEAASQNGAPAGSENEGDGSSLSSTKSKTTNSTTRKRSSSSTSGPSSTSGGDGGGGGGSGESSDNTGLFIGIAVAILLVGAAVAVALSQKNDSSSNPRPPPPTPSY